MRTALFLLLSITVCWAGRHRHPLYQGAILSKDPDFENEVGKAPSVAQTESNLPDSDVIAKVLPEQLEAYYYGIYADLINSETPIFGRSGNSTVTSSCENVRSVPDEFRHPSNMRPRISFFYQKYTEAYGIPVIGSAKVPDKALSRACYVLRFLLADRTDLRHQFYKSYGRIAIMATTENTTDIPEHSFLPRVYYNQTRGLGAISIAPVSTAGVENVLCMHNDTYRKEDILVREIALGIQHLAVRHVVPNFRETLRRLFQQATLGGWWSHTYAALTPDSYFGEGVQSYFNVNSYGNKRGSNNHVNNRSKLRMYDPQLYMLIEQLWPCGNRYLKRCHSRGFEHYQKLRMDCHPFRYGPL